MTLEEAIKELRDASDSEVRYGDKDNHYDKVMKRVEAFEMAIKALEQQSSEDCISRAYIESIVEELENICINGDEYMLSLLSDIKNAPSVTPQQRVGKWIAQDIHNCHTDFKCSECGYIHNFTHLYGEPTADYTYCPRCGVKMEVEE